MLSFEKEYVSCLPVWPPFSLVTFLFYLYDSSFWFLFSTFSSSTGDWTKGIKHTRQMFFNWTISSNLYFFSFFFLTLRKGLTKLHILPWTLSVAQAFIELLIPLPQSPTKPSTCNVSCAIGWSSFYYLEWETNSYPSSLLLTAWRGLGFISSPAPSQINRGNHRK